LAGVTPEVAAPIGAGHTNNEAISILPGGFGFVNAMNGETLEEFARAEMQHSFP